MASDLAFLTHIHSPQRCVVPCENAQHRSRTEEARGSNPLTSTPPLMTSANAGHLHVRGRFEWPHNAWKLPHFATFEGMNQGPPDRLLRSLERYLRDATRADLEDFLADRLARRSAATAATRYKVLRVLYRWLEEEEDVLNPMEKMRRRSSPSSP
jgi:hypothetical protein